MTPTRTQDHFPWEVQFSNELRRLRTESDLSLYALARALSGRGLPFHQQQLDRIERGERGVRLNEAVVIAAYFGLSLEAMAGVGQEHDQPGELDLLVTNLKEAVTDLCRYSDQAAVAYAAIFGLRGRVATSGDAMLGGMARTGGDHAAETTAVEASANLASVVEAAFGKATRTSAHAIHAARAQSSLLDEWLA